MLNLINTIEDKSGILTRTEQGWQGEDWQQLLSNSYLEMDTLLEMLGLQHQQLKACEKASKDFRLCAPAPWLKRIIHADPNDPLLLQILPQSTELADSPGFVVDPLNEAEYNPRKGIIHKYHGRVLLITSQACAINCRYCFRRHFPYPSQRNNREQWLENLSYIANDNSIREVILSGGDPLVSNDRQLGWLIGELESIPHLKRLRIHSRLPIVIPQRVTKSLLDKLEQSRLDCTMVVHSNHPNEIDADVTSSLAMIAKRGITLLNQSVLLAGVNDNSQTLVSLSEKLHENKVLPYYLHLLDPVAGAAHFAVEQSRALGIYSKMRKELPGYLLPRLVREEPGKDAKTAIIP